MPFEKTTHITKNIRLFSCYGLLLILSACGNDYPKLTQFKAFDQRFNTVIDTTDKDELVEFSALFFNRSEADNALADLSFDYLFDLTTAEGSERWRCTKNGYCQKRTSGAEMQMDIYYVERYKELYKKANLK